MKSPFATRLPFASVLLAGLLFAGLTQPVCIPDTRAGVREKKLIKKLKKKVRASKKQLALVSYVDPGPAPVIQMVKVRNAGNEPDQDFGDGQFGAVEYDFRIGKYEVTLEQYAAFLNAVAATDMYGLYNPDMATDLNVAGILQEGESGSYTYSVIGNGNRPVTYVSWFDAARFCNWLHNGRPTGPQDETTTEQGAYYLNTVTTGDVTIIRNADAKYFIPSEDEWYKAAYHQPAGQRGDSDGYWSFPTRSNTAPGNAIGSAANQMNYYDGDYSVTQSSVSDSNQNYLTAGGSYSGSSSFYGTFDQGGNVYEWNEGVINDAYRSVRGGWYLSGEANVRSSHRQEIFTPESEGKLLGFRIASP